MALAYCGVSVEEFGLLRDHTRKFTDDSIASGVLSE
jgi:hypothetical protein